MENKNSGARLSTPSDVSMAEDAPIMGAGFAPGEIVTLSLAFQDAARTSWRASARFRADALGKFNTRTDAPLDGAYEGVDIGGLFWSARPAGAENGDLYLRRALRDASLPLTPAPDPLGDVRYKIEAIGERGARVSARLTRRRLPEGVVVQPVREGGLRGLFFAPRTQALGAALIIGGSEGGLIPTRAAQLAGEGVAALALGYFQYEDRPQAAIDLPIEYFAAGLQWLRKRTPHARIAMFGSSRGSEAALLTAQNYPELVDALALWVPSHIINAGLDPWARDFRREQRAMWSIKGAPLAGATFPDLTEEELSATRCGMAAPNGWRFAPEFLRLWRAPGIAEQFAAPLDRIQVPVLLVSGEDDGLWPSAFGASRLAEAFGARATHLCLPKVGHSIGVPNEAQPFVQTRIWRDGYFGIDAGFVDVGGRPAASGQGARTAWRALVEFLQSAVG